MRTQFVGLGVMLVVAAMTVSDVRAEDGRPSRQTLAAMGLGSMVVMSDDDAMNVRGQGYQGGGSSVAVSGNSFATINGGPLGGAHSENAYAADGKHKASGSNSSYAGAAVISTGGGHKGQGRPCGKPHGGGHGGKPNGGGGYGGGKPSVKIHAIVFFAGGHSSAKAW